MGEVVFPNDGLSTNTVVREQPVLGTYGSMGKHSARSSDSDEARSSLAPVVRGSVLPSRLLGVGQALAAGMDFSSVRCNC